VYEALRRTLITVAELIDLQPYAIKRMVNHKMRGDVTARYIVADVERLRAGRFGASATSFARRSASRVRPPCIRFALRK